MKLKTCFSGLFDQMIHSTENVDLVGLIKHLHPKVIIAGCNCSIINVRLLFLTIFFVSPGNVRFTDVRRDQPGFMFPTKCYWLWSCLLQPHLEWGLVHLPFFGHIIFQGSYHFYCYCFLNSVLRSLFAIVWSLLWNVAMICYDKFYNGCKNCKKGKKEIIVVGFVPCDSFAKLADASIGFCCRCIFLKVPRWYFQPVCRHAIQEQGDQVISIQLVAGIKCHCPGTLTFSQKKLVSLSRHQRIFWFYLKPRFGLYYIIIYVYIYSQGRKRSPLFSKKERRDIRLKG